MRVPEAFGGVMLFAVCGVAAGVFAPSDAAAQSRTAGIRVQATVRAAGDADLLGAHAVTMPDAAPQAGAARAAEHWRITAGGGASVGIRVDGGATVAICETPADGAETREPCRAARAAIRARGGAPDLVVRVRPAAPGDAVRITVAYIDF